MLFRRCTRQTPNAAPRPLALPAISTFVSRRKAVSNGDGLDAGLGPGAAPVSVPTNTSMPSPSPPFVSARYPVVDRINGVENTRMGIAIVWTEGRQRGQRASRCQTPVHCSCETAARRIGDTKAARTVSATSEFHLREIAPATYLLTYTLQQDTKLTRRATIWQRRERDWTVLYHQGTLVSDPTLNVVIHHPQVDQ